MKPQIYHYRDLETLSLMAAEYICTLAAKSARERGIVTFALAGGNTPKPVYECLAGPRFGERMPWAHTHLFWGDERCVPPDHPDSNFGMASRALISKVPIPPQNLHRIPAEMASPEKAAEAYEKILREFFGYSARTDTHSSGPYGGRLFPSFDLILLGIGRDGHTASLFPGDQAVDEEKRWVAAVLLPHSFPTVPRITVTSPVINSARYVLFLVSGAEKRDVVRQIVNDPETASRSYPAARIQPEGTVVWFLDEEASY